MKFYLPLSLLLVTQFISHAQTTKPFKAPMTADKWQVNSPSTEFIQYKGVPAIKISADTEKIILKDYQFTNGTIEFDVESLQPPFTSVFFRRKGNDESELFYLRVARAGSPLAIDAIQYCPVIKSVILWDMLPYYQGPANIKKGEWNHIKLIVSGLQMLVFVNDMQTPALQVPHLEGNTSSGGIAFNGKSVFANLVISPNETGGLSPASGYDPTANDPRYLRDWLVSQPAPMPFGKEVYKPDLPAASTAWEKLQTERRGLVNLTRLYGITPERRIVWLKKIIKSDKEQVKKIDLGFSDEVWVLVNGQLDYVDKNWYGSPIAKQPDGRCSLENTSFMLPLKAGENELLIGVTNFFFGWGIIARMENLDGISF